MNNAKRNNTIFSLENQPLFTREGASYITKHYSFGILSTEVPLWTPSPTKCINLTSVQASAPLGVTLTLSSNGNAFFALRVTSHSAAISQQFPSEYRFKPNDAISLRTSDEERATETSGASNATQVAYNSRSDFINVANATGLPNMQFATLNSALITRTSGRLVLEYSNLVPSASSQLQIESVKINFYCRLSLTLAVGTSSMIYYWRPDPAEDWIQLQQESLSLIGTIDHLSVPIQQDITTEVLAATNPWNVIKNMQTSFVGGHTGLGLGNTIQLDAVVIDIRMVGKNEISLFGSET
ncbi:hypothetical protein [Desulforamulus aeronauticus]|uniref:Uncharacterized protein n=1 Tax=Desulforamulus aeronauticus DSM 10349 TaxID=1121421 RepID=A0A1M6TY91_9FIRM|nr:hypothetical protein [Desulforamulus aeronauticus]SHK61854.1 hypothetical protein SAMN02745123_02503 [Desulforamulus aeronauticus DSM 10349]